MIGSSTLIVKQAGKYHLHVYNGGLCFACFGNEKATKQDYFEAMKLNNSEWGKPDRVNLTQEEIDSIRTSHQCINPKEPNYSEFAGDTVGLLDLDAGVLYGRNGRDNGDQWVEYDPNPSPKLSVERV